MIRCANAFNAAGVHIVGHRRWNRRGAMVTDRYMHVWHHPTIADLLAWTVKEDLTIIGVDNLPGAVDIREADLPERCMLLFGQEGPGLSDEARTHAAAVLSIPQFGSTRSINAGVASGIAMFRWVQLHAR